MKCNSFLLSFFILFVLNLSVKAQSGANDPTFNPTDVGFGFGDGASGEVQATAIQSDGKIIIGGAFATYNGKTVNHIARLNSDGTIDVNFNMGKGTNGNVSSVVIQADGKIIIGGDFSSYNGTAINRIARLNQDGTIDTSFSPGTGANMTIKTMALQPDGKIIVAGGFSNYNGIKRNKIARLNEDGTLDPTFDPAKGADAWINTILMQSDGKIIIAGDFTTYNETTRNKIARLNADGTLDVSFTPNLVSQGYLYTINIQSDGKIIIAGILGSYDQPAGFCIARLNINGSFDNSFQFNGDAFVHVHSAVIQVDGKIIIAGASSNDLSSSNITRLNEDGTIDPSFALGKVLSYSSKNSLLKQRDGKIIIAGNFISYDDILTNRIARINSDGTLDVSFNSCKGADASVRTVFEQSDGKIIIGGRFTSYKGINKNHIARLNADGSLDATFQLREGANGDVETIIQQSDGKILIGGKFSSYNGTTRTRIARLNSDGTLDATFDPGYGVNGDIYRAVIQFDGKIIIAGGFSSCSGVTRNSIARLNSDGTLDTTFDTRIAENQVISSVVLQVGGKIIISGYFKSCNGVARNSIARLNSDGTLDDTFTYTEDESVFVSAIAMQSDGRIIVGGDFPSYNGVPMNRIFRLNSDGTLDTTFNPGTGVNGPIATIAIQRDAKVIFGGQFTSYNETQRNNIARVNEDGTLDTSFNLGVGANNCVNAIAIQSDGNILIGGDFTSYNGVGRNRIARILNSISNETRIVKSKAISVYPNPVSSALNIEIAGNKELLNYEILNTTGQTVFKGSLVEKASVQTSSFAPGIYLIKLGNDNVYELKKIIKE